MLHRCALRTACTKHYVLYALITRSVSRPLTQRVLVRATRCRSLPPTVDFFPDTTNLTPSVEEAQVSSGFYMVSHTIVEDLPQTYPPDHSKSNCKRLRAPPRQPGRPTDRKGGKSWYPWRGLSKVAGGFRQVPEKVPWVSGGFQGVRGGGGLLGRKPRRITSLRNFICRIRVCFRDKRCVNGPLCLVAVFCISGQSEVHASIDSALPAASGRSSQPFR